jgi:hypothetical protein
MVMGTIAALATSACGSTVPACEEELVAGIVKVSQPTAADRALVAIDPAAAQAEVFHQRGAGRDVRICLGVSDDGRFTEDRRVVYAVRFDQDQGTQVMLVDASTGEMLGGGGISP